MFLWNYQRQTTGTKKKKLTAKYYINNKKFSYQFSLHHVFSVSFGFAHFEIGRISLNIHRLFVKWYRYDILIFIHGFHTYSNGPVSIQFNEALTTWMNICVCMYIYSHNIKALENQVSTTWNHPSLTVNDEKYNPQEIMLPRNNLMNVFILKRNKNYEYQFIDNV